MARYRITINPRNQWDEDVIQSKVSPRELEVLALIADGTDYYNIAGVLNIKYQTVKTHAHNIVKKLGAHNVTEAFMLALAKGLVRVTTDMGNESEKWRGMGHRSGGD